MVIDETEMWSIERTSGVKQAMKTATWSMWSGAELSGVELEWTAAEWSVSGSELSGVVQGSSTTQLVNGRV